MKTFYYTLSVVAIYFFSFQSANAQDLPLFTQKLTNAFLYNPALAGNGLGSVSFSNRNSWSKVPGAPSSNFLNAHMPFGYHKFGTGLSILQEKVNIYDNIFVNAAFAYHLPINEETVLSMGLSTEFSYLKINANRVDVLDPSDVLLINPGAKTNIDFSFGLNLKSRFFHAGVSTNRLVTAFSTNSFDSQITQFYTGYVIGKLYNGRGNLLEPMFAYRVLTDQSAQWDAGFYYTHRKTVILGLSYRQSGVISPAFGFKFRDKYMVGYSFEMFGSEYKANVGNTHEVTLRVDFWDDSYSKNTRNSGKVMENAVNFRRKTMTTNTFRNKPMSASSSKYKKRLKRNYVKNPNYRISSSEKLNDRNKENKKDNQPGFFAKLFRGGNKGSNNKPLENTRKSTPGMDQLSGGTVEKRKENKPSFFAKLFSGKKKRSSNKPLNKTRKSTPGLNNKN